MLSFFLYGTTIPNYLTFYKIVIIITPINTIVVYEPILQQFYFDTWCFAIPIQEEASLYKSEP